MQEVLVMVKQLISVAAVAIAACISAAMQAMLRELSRVLGTITVAPVR
jgi:hypothetical protein